MILQPGKRYVTRDGNRVVTIKATFGDRAVGVYYTENDMEITKDWDVRGGFSLDPSPFDLVMELSK